MRDIQLDLAEEAICMTFSRLASHERRKEVKDYMHALVDVMYTSTDDAQKTHSKSEREQISVAAYAVREHLQAGLNEILRESAKILAAQEENSALRVVFRSLNETRVHYLDHAPTHLLFNMIQDCYFLCLAYDRYDLGLDGAESNFVERLNSCGLAALQIQEFVIDAVESGDLIVEQGKIIDPKQDSS
ncbi:MAG: hypothetical protein MK081_15705 [Flavobacteriales bacterium]|nr:hypothetical protein [Flavobacteriales bacterium]